MLLRRLPARQFVAAVTLLALVQGCGSSGATTPTTTTVASVSLTPVADTLVSGQTVQLTATPKDASGAAVSGQTVIWSTSPTTIATVNNTGVVTGVTTGTATVTATSGGKSATATVVVTAGALVPVSGGTVSTSDGSVTLTFPAQALAAATPVSIRPVVIFPASNLLIGAPYDFGPTGTTFAQPVTVKMTYDPARLAAGAVLQLIQLYTVTGDHWTAVPGSTVDTVAHTVTAPLSHFSSYAPCIQGCALAIAGNITMDCVAPCSLHVPVGGSGGPITGTVAGEGDLPISGPFRLTMGSLPAGLAGTLTMTGSNTWSLFVTASAAAVPGHVSSWVMADLSQPGVGAAAVEGAQGVQLFVDAPGFTLTPGGTGFSVVQGDTVSTPLTLTRTLWTPAVSFTAQHLPSGTTAAFSPPTTTGNSSTVTFTVGASTAPGNYTVTIVGSSPGHADVTATLGLSVTPGSGFTIAGTPAFATVAQGGSSSTGLQATRTNFSSSIAYTFAGLPTGVTAAVTSTSVADSNRLTFTATSGAAVGTYPVIVTGTSGSTVRTATISLVVSPSGTTIVQADFSTCSAGQLPVWVVYQDGNGAFTQASGSGPIYPITFNAARGVIAAVFPNITTGFTTVVNYGTPAELLALPWSCNAAFPSGKTLSVSATGLLPNDIADIGMGGATGGVSWTDLNGSTSLSFVVDGLQDLVAYRYHYTIPGTDIRWAIRRDLDIPTGGSVATIDFTGPESFAPAIGNFAFSAGSEQSVVDFGYVTRPNCTGVQYGVYNGVRAPLPNDHSFFGIPAAQQRAADLHAISVSTPTRSTTAYFHAVTQATVNLNLGASMPTPNVVSLGGPYKRLQALFNLPSDYAITRLSYGLGSTGVELQAGTGYFAGGQTTLAMPDLSGVSGYSAAWFPANGTGGWGLVGQSAIDPNTACVDGGSYRSSRVSGTN